MVAAGNASGEVSVFQIRKEHPPDLKLPPTIEKPLSLYTIRNMHSKEPIRCVEWSKNGMKLFSGARNGVVVQTDFDYVKVSSSRTSAPHKN